MRSGRNGWQLAATVVLAGGLTAASMTLILGSNSKDSSSSAATSHSGASCPEKLPGSTVHYLGAITRPALASAPFKENIGEFYTAFGSSFPVTVASEYRSRHMLPFIQVNPRKVKLSDVARGRYDSYLRTYAEAARQFCSPLVYSVGHEFNGNWYPWGHRHTRPAVFVAAWRHMHDIFTQEKASNVVWAWDPDHAAQDPVPWWPGSSYVSWIGIDGYFRKPGQTSFRVLFGERIANIRKFSKAPILIAETGAPPSRHRAKQLQILLDGMRSYGLLGLIYFDIPAIQDYRIDHDQAALAVLKRESAAIVH
jgi:Glycosyl hydrolase family 26